LKQTIMHLSQKHSKMYTDSVDHLPNTLCTYTILEPRSAEPIKSTYHSSEQSTLKLKCIQNFIAVCLVSKNSMELTFFLRFLLCLLQFVFQHQANQLIPRFQTVVRLWTNGTLQNTQPWPQRSFKHIEDVMH
jgi:hypothetical protein